MEYREETGQRTMMTTLQAHCLAPEDVLALAMEPVQPRLQLVFRNGVFHPGMQDDGA
ncbi:hypothetical protein ABC383_22045 [Noviherbaspirillum sp. 1P10PC]|uniref:hypothetical protein n=1 Tax=Noviherbaspirillum sp. 1P10PC TaxID=3132292 RepID=UPI0039A1CB44